MALYIALIYLVVLGITVVLLAGLLWRAQSGKGRVQVVVLGDAGRSPRMQYHSLSLVDYGITVDLVGYEGSSLIQELRASERLTFHKLTEPPSLPALRLIRYVAKVVYQTINLLWVMLRRTKKPSHMIVQTPPSIPTIFVAVTVCYLRGSKLIMDYHNYGHTVLALALGNKHPLVRVLKIYEKILSKFAHANLCVSEAMKKDMQENMSISATVFYDRPPKRFKSSTSEQKHELFKKLGETNLEFRADDSTHNITSMTALTQLKEGKVEMRRGRPFLLISSTSWTEDEDFSILLDALEEYNAAAGGDDDLPNILCVITGKGPLKEYYQRIIRTKNFSHVQICTMWLSAEDYPILLGSADLGVCLHKSSSGLDLPMKVVDMFGCGLPVCAIKFGCLHELVKNGHNGMVFSESSELCAQFLSLCRGFPKNDKLSQLRNNLASFQELRWDHYWKQHVLPLVTNRS